MDNNYILKANILIKLIDHSLPVATKNTCDIMWMSEYSKNDWFDICSMKELKILNQL